KKVTAFFWARAFCEHRKFLRRHARWDRFENFVSQAFPIGVFEKVRRAFGFLQLSLSEPRQQKHRCHGHCKTHCHCHSLCPRGEANSSGGADARMVDTHWHSTDCDCKSHDCPPAHSAGIVQTSCTGNPSIHCPCRAISPRTKARSWHLPAAD